MRHRHTLAALLAFATVVALPALASAEGDDFFVGNGSAGALTVGNTRVVNTYAQVMKAIAPHDASITLATTTGFGAGDLVLVLETTGLAAPTSGAQTAVDLSASQVASWELARVASTTATTLVVNAPMIHSFAAGVTQVVRVPEYTNLTVNGTINAAPWNGSTGGVVAFLVSGTLTLTGAISANGLGFRGGVAVDSNGDHLGCTELDLPGNPQFPVSAWAQKGEGVFATGYGNGFQARGNFANGAGGGDCDNSGGGGGANAGAGGQGGDSWQGDGSRAVGGLGGAALTYSLLDHMTLGGGGGAGQEDDNVGTSGGAGGGLVFVRAAAVTGIGTLSANGASAANSGNDGAGGGGAGGSIYLRVSGNLTCAALDLSAVGGDGGNVNDAALHGPGAGGGGGRVLIQGNAVIACSPATGSGAAGTERDGSNHGATPPATVANGSAVVITGTFTQPATPTLVTPADGSSTSDTTPTFSGTAPANTIVIIYLDGVPVGSTTSDANGHFSFTPTTALGLGTHVGQAASSVQGEESPKSTGNSFTIATTPPTAPVVLVPPNGGITNDSTPVISGTAQPGATVRVSVDGVVLGNTTADTDGNWSYTPTSGQALSDGTHLVNAVTVDGGVTSPPSNTDQFTVDTLAPAAPLVIMPANGSTTNDPTPTISGTAEPVSTVRVIVDGNQIATTPVDVNGRWTYDLTDQQHLAAGMHTAQAQAVDLAGNASPLSNINTFTVSTVVVGTPIIETPPNGLYTNNARPSFSGSAVAGSTVTLFVDGLVYGTVTADAGGRWTYNPPLGQDLADGTHAAFVVASDGMGNMSAPSNTNTFTVDTISPDTTIITGPPLTDAPPSGSFLFASNESPVSFECSVDGGTFVLCPDPAMVGPLGPGTHVFQVRAVDRAGNRDPLPATYSWVVGLDIDAGLPIDARVVPDATIVPDAPVVPDASVPDASIVTIDASIPDATAIPDTRPADARLIDAAFADAAATDARIGPDARPADAGIGPDARLADAGKSDAKPSSPDAAIGGTEFKGGGCSCRVSPGSAGGGGAVWGGLFAMGLIGLALRRKRR